MEIRVSWGVCGLPCKAARRRVAAAPCISWPEAMRFPFWSRRAGDEQRGYRMAASAINLPTARANADVRREECTVPVQLPLVNSYGGILIPIPPLPFPSPPPFPSRTNVLRPHAPRSRTVVAVGYRRRLTTKPAHRHSRCGGGLPSWLADQPCARPVKLSLG